MSAEKSGRATPRPLHRLPQRHCGQRRHVFALPAQYAGGSLVSAASSCCSRKPGRQPVHEGMIKVQGHAELSGDPRGEIAAADMLDHLREHRQALIVGPSPPIHRQQEHGPPPADRGRRGQSVLSRYLDRASATQFGTNHVHELEVIADRSPLKNRDGNLRTATNPHAIRHHHHGAEPALNRPHSTRRARREPPPPTARCRRPTRSLEEKRLPRSPGSIDRVSTEEWATTGLRTGAAWRARPHRPRLPGLRQRPAPNSGASGARG